MRAGHGEVGAGREVRRRLGGPHADPERDLDRALVTQTTFSNYKDRAEVLTDIKTPGRIVRTQGGKTVLDLEVKTWETNNPYLVFPVPPSVRAAATSTAR